MRRRTFTTAFALGVPALALGAPALADGPPAAWTPARSRALRDRAAQLTPRLTDRARRLMAVADTERLVDADTLERAIDGSQYECAPTGLTQWLGEQVADFTDEDLAIITGLFLMEWPMLHALVFEPDGPQHYGPDGEYTKAITKTFRTLQKFWDVDGSHIRLAAMHSDLLVDADATTALVELLFELPTPEARELATEVAAFLSQPKFDGGRHPLFSFNAFAFSDQALLGDEGLGSKIIMGDGMLQALDALGLGDVAPQGILAHEYGHQLQFSLGLGAEEQSPEATRLTELEADALSGYYLSHPRGERLRNRRVEAFLRAYFQLGDCAFDDPGHHGTPNQRAEAGHWAYDLANAKGAKGHVRPAAQVSALFREDLPEILAPDA